MQTNSAYVETQMLIRKPAAEVFEAMTNPSLTTNFWFTKSSGKLTSGATVVWEWEMYGAKADVQVLEVTPNEKLVFEWGPKRKVTFTFKPMGQQATYVTAREDGYTETGDALPAVIRDSTSGFTTVLDGLKAFLEFGIRLNLIGDKFPSGK